jgi:hypothetical protein
MKTLTITQSYELEVSVTVQVPDDYTLDDIQNTFADFPITVAVDSKWDDYRDNDEVICYNDIAIEHLNTHGLPVPHDSNGNLVDK